MVDLTSYLPLLLMGLHQCKEGALASLDCSVIHLNFTHVMDVVTKVTNLIRGEQVSKSSEIHGLSRGGGCCLRWSTAAHRHQVDEPR